MRALTGSLLRVGRVLAVLGAVICVASLALAFRMNWGLGGVAERIESALLTASQAAGFELVSVSLSGRARADKSEILAAIGVPRGGPIFLIDPERVRARLEALDWIDSASVRRVLPGRLEIDIREAQPIAIWQEAGRFALIDARGRKITEQGIEAFPQLPLVVGEGAATHAAELFAMLDTQQALRGRISAMVRVGDRRWNFRFDNNVDLLLPEFDAGEAWMRFARLEQQHRLLARAVTQIDMRLSDRLVVRLTDEGMKTLRLPGRNT